MEDIFTGDIFEKIEPPHGVSFKIVGTALPTNLLQRNGFSRESATYIRNHKDEYVVHGGSGSELKLKSSLLTCGNTSVMTEAASINFNVPGLFLEEDA